MSLASLKSLGVGFQGFCSSRAFVGMEKFLAARAMSFSTADGSAAALNPRLMETPA
jgi:hypothetical protein